MENGAEWFACAACGKRFRWKAELAGREARCPCGAVIRFPDRPDAEDAGYDLAPEPVRAAPVQAAAMPAKSFAAGVAPPPTLGYQTPPKFLPPGQKDGVDVDTLKKQTIPLWLLVGGIVVEMAASMLENRHDLNAAMIHITVEIVGGTILMLAGVMLAAKIRGIEIGSFWSAALRVAAISVAPAAVGDLLMPIMWMIPFGGFVQLGIQFVLYFALLGVLFDLDESDTWYCVMLIFLINLGIYFLLSYAPWGK